MRLIPAADLSKTLAAWRRSHLHSATSFPSFRIEYEAWQALTRMLPFRGNQGTESDGFELLLGHLIDHLQLIFADAAKGSTKCDYPKLEGPNLDDLDRIHALLETEALDTVNRGTYLRYLAETRRLVHLLGSLPVSLEGYLGFRRSALSAFRFLTDEYGFSVSETSPISVRFESEALHFELSHSPDYPMLSLRVGRREIGGDSHIGFSLDDFYYATGMGIAFEYDSYDMLDSSGIEKFLCTAALIVRTRGHLLLRVR